MKIQDELLTGIVSADPQQLKKTSAAQTEADFAALLEEELGQGQNTSQLVTGLKGLNPLAGLTGIDALGNLLESAPAGGFSDQENQFMDELGALLDVVDSYSLALAGQTAEGGLAETSLKSVYNILDTITQKAQELKGMLGELGNNPALASLVNELEVLASTEKFKFNRGDYLT